MATNDFDWSKMVAPISRPNYYDSLRTTTDPYNDNASINDITGMDLLEVIEKGIYRTLVTRRDDAKAVWEEEDDDASYGEYKALKDAVELLEAFIKQAPNARYSGVRNRERYNPRYGTDGYRF